MLRLLSLVFILLCLFPFIQIVPIPTDSQPNALCVALFFLMLHPVRKIDNKFGFLLVALAVACVVFFLGEIHFSAIRALFNYFSLFFLTMASYYILIQANGMPYRLYFYSVLFVFLVGSVQFFIYPDFLSFLIPRGDSSMTLQSGRGIVCLAPEPTFYGIICMLLMMIGYMNFSTRKGIKLLQLSLVIQLLFYSRSSTCIFILVLSLFVYYIFLVWSLKKWKILFFLCTLFAILVSIMPLLSEMLINYRIGKLLVYLYDNPTLFVTMDASVNERFNHIFFPINGFIDNWGIPYGFDAFEGYMQKCFQNPSYQMFFSTYIYNASYNRIMSAIAGAFFELGIFAIAIVFFIYKVFKPLMSVDKNMVFVFILFMSILMNAMTFSNAIIPFFLGNIMFLNYQKMRL